MLTAQIVQEINTGNCMVTITRDNKTNSFEIFNLVSAQQLVKTCGVEDSNVNLITSGELLNELDELS